MWQPGHSQGLKPSWCRLICSWRSYGLMNSLLHLSQLTFDASRRRYSKSGLKALIIVPAKGIGIWWTVMKWLIRLYWKCYASRYFTCLCAKSLFVAVQSTTSHHSLICYAQLFSDRLPLLPVLLGLSMTSSAAPPLCVEAVELDLLVMPPAKVQYLALKCYAENVCLFEKASKESLLCLIWCGWNCNKLL